MEQKGWLELSEGHENRYEGGDGRCRRNDIFCFWDRARAARALVRKVRKSSHFHGFMGKSGSKNCRRVMKIGMKEEMGVTKEMTSSVLGLRAGSTRICARSAQIHSFSWSWGKSCS